MEIGRRLLGRLAGALAFVILVGLGLLAGSVLSATEALDEQLAPKKRVKHSRES